VNPIGHNTPEGPSSEEPESDDSALLKPKRRYRTVASSDFNQGATGARGSPRLIVRKGGPSVSTQTNDQNNSQNNDQALYTNQDIYDLDVRDAFEYGFAAVEGVVPIPKNTKEALADPVHKAHWKEAIGVELQKLQALNT